MKIYTYIKMDIETGEILEENSFEYQGPVAECKGGGSTVNSVDPAYNARMASIAEAQQGMAEEYFDFWRDSYKPLEEAQIQSNLNMLPSAEAQQIAESEMATQQAQGMTAANYDDGSGGKTSLLQLGLNEQAAQIGLQGELRQTKSDQATVARQAYNDAMNGIDVNNEVSMARADVANSFAGATSSMNRDLARSGANTSGAGYQNAMAGLARDRAKSMASGMTSARANADDRQFTRRTMAAGLGI